MIRLLLIVVITTHSCGYSTAATARSELDNILTDITNSICYLDFFQQAFLYLDFCRYDGFDRCDETFYPGNFEIISLNCNKCSNHADVNVVWNIHLFSKNYNITVSCQNDSCTSKNEHTELLNIEQDFTIGNTTLEFYYSLIYQESLVGCIATADNCTENQYWIINNPDFSRSHNTRIFNPSNGTTYYVALGESLIIGCNAYDSFRSTVGWSKGNTSVNQLAQHCYDFDINNSTCISPSLHDYKKERVRSRLFKTELCESYVIINSSLDIAIVDWKDNGSSYRCISRWNALSEDFVAEVHVNIIVDVIPEFLQLPPHYSEQSTSSSYSCVAKAGWGARVQWFNASSHEIQELIANDTSPPSVYVTYSTQNISTVFKANNFSYTGDPVDSVYPVHNATLHYNGASYHHQNKSFVCVITGVDKGFLKQYNLTDNNLDYFMTVYTIASADSSKLTVELVIGIIIGIVLILATILFIILLYYGQCRRSRKRKLSIQAPFSKLTFESTVDLKSVNNSSEAQFPREKVALLEVLGEGNFGVVWKAKAEGIVQNAPHLNIVAVKTVKDPLNRTAINDLWAEMVILLKMKPHLNICNLLGYCNGESESLYILLEYCVFGKLKDYLQSCDDVLIELGLPVKLNDYTVDVQESRHSMEYINILQSNSNHNSSAKMLTTDCNDVSMLNVPSDSGYGDSIAYVPESVDSGYTSWSISESLVPASRDYINLPGMLYNQDITNFALQIGHGLQHLENLKICHGDLSARNVLIAEGFVLKIADFGQARDLGTQEYYRRQSERPLPVKWMAIESLKEAPLCTHKSDMWSYGVLLWEIATYGKSPYQDVPNEDMLQHLQEGNRLPCPDGCSDFWYNLMLQCWSEDTDKRPSGSQIVEQLSKPFLNSSTNNTIIGLTTAV